MTTPIKYKNPIYDTNGILTSVEGFQEFESGKDHLPLELLPFGFNENAKDLAQIAEVASQANAGVLIKTTSNTSSPWALSSANSGYYLGGDLTWSLPPGSIIVNDETSNKNYTIKLYSEESSTNTYTSNTLYYNPFTKTLSSNTISANNLVISNTIISNGNVTINGDLLVKGNTTNIDVETLTVKDSFIELRTGNSVTPDDSGIQFNLSTNSSGYVTSSKTFKWNNTKNRFQINNDDENYANVAVNTDKLSTFANTSSAELQSIIIDSTGTGNLVFSNSATLNDPTIKLTNNNLVANLNSEFLNGRPSTYYTTANNLTGTIPSSVLQNSHIYIGNTEIALNRTANAITLTGITSIDGSAGKLTTPRIISLLGDVSGNTLFDGSENVEINVTIEKNSIELGTDTTGNYTESVNVSGLGLSISGSPNEKSNYVIISNATANDIPETIVYRNQFGSFSANVITAELNGNAKTVTNGIYTTQIYTDPDWIQISKSKIGLANVKDIDATNASNLTGTIPSNVLQNSSVYIGNTEINLARTPNNIELTGIISIDGSAAKLTTPRTISLINGASGNTIFDGSENISINVTEINSNNIVGKISNDHILNSYIIINDQQIELGNSINVAPPDLATINSPGMVQLDDSLSSNSISKAATAYSVKRLNDALTEFSSGVFTSELLQITTTSLVANLNSELLNGHSSEYYTTADNLTGTIPNTVLGNSSFYIGNTSITLNRTAGNLSLEGIELDDPILNLTNNELVQNLNSDLLDGQHGSYYTTANNLTGTIPSNVLGNSSIYIGNTVISLNRTSNNIELTGITSIDGSAAKLTTPRTIALTGAAYGNTIFDGSEDISINVYDLDTNYLSGKLENSRLINSNITINTENGLNGGGIAELGSSLNISANNASINSKGITKLNATINSTTKEEAATPSAVKMSYDMALMSYASPEIYSISFQKTNGTIEQTSNLKKFFPFVKSTGQMGRIYLNSDGKLPFITSTGSTIGI